MITPVVVIPRPRPREIVIDVFFVAVSIAFILGLTPPLSVESQVPVPWRWVWYLLLLTGGACTLASYARRRWDDRLILERHGCVASAAGCLIFAVCAWSYTGWSATFAAGLMTAWAIAHAWRIWQIQREIYPPAREDGPWNSPSSQQSRIKHRPRHRDRDQNGSSPPSPSSPASESEDSEPPGSPPESRNES